MAEHALADFVGVSFQYADYSMRHGQTESGGALRRNRPPLAA